MRRARLVGVWIRGIERLAFPLSGDVWLMSVVLVPLRCGVLLVIDCFPCVSAATRLCFWPPAELVAVGVERWVGVCKVLLALEKEWWPEAVVPDFFCDCELAGSQRS